MYLLLNFWNICSIICLPLLTFKLLSTPADSLDKIYGGPEVQMGVVLMLTQKQQEAPFLILHFL